MHSVMWIIPLAFLVSVRAKVSVDELIDGALVRSADAHVLHDDELPQTKLRHTYLDNATLGKQSHVAMPVAARSLLDSRGVCARMSAMEAVIPHRRTAAHGVASRWSRFPSQQPIETRLGRCRAQATATEPFVMPPLPFTIPKVPVTIVTGFLGSGKTTLLNNILTKSHGKRIAVIENEYGEIGIDKDLVAAAKSGSQDDELTIMQLSNGCLCCTVMGDLVDGLNSLTTQYKDKFDHIVIETTGLAAVAPIIQTFYTDRLDVKDRVFLDGVVTLVDAKHVTQHLDAQAKMVGKTVNEALEQIAYADRIVLNKIDLVSADELTALERRLRQVNQMAEITRAEKAEVGVEYVLGVGGFDLDKIEEEGVDELIREKSHDHGHDHGHKHGHDHGHNHGHKQDHDHSGEDCEVCKEEGHHHHHHHHDHQHDDRISTLSMEVKGDMDTDKVNEWLLSLLQYHHQDLYRMKGIVSLEGFKQKFVYQGVHAEFECRSQALWKEGEERKSQLVFIGKELPKEKIRKEFMECLVTPPPSLEDDAVAQHDHVRTTEASENNAELAKEEAEKDGSQIMEEFHISHDELKSLKVPELQARLRERGLPTTGRKSELVERLLTS